MKRETAASRAEQFLSESGQFRLGKLLTESPHPVTRRLSQAAAVSIPEALQLLFTADRDVLEKYRDWITTGAPERIKEEVLAHLLEGRKVFFTGCGSTGRLSIQMDSIWRDFWQKLRARGFTNTEDWEDRTRSVMAGGDFALIKSVEGFEDFTQFGAQQIEDLGVAEGDIVFAITEGGETSFVIGTAWKALEKGAKVYFVYNNPDATLRENVIRSREVIDEPRIEKINLTTGPMSITGSTRMQATSIQLCVLLTIFEMVLRDLLSQITPSTHAGEGELPSKSVPTQFLAALETAHDTLLSPEVREQLAGLVAMEENVYKNGKKNTYFADRLAIDVLTDTTERSPTYCVPAFKKFDDRDASQSWSFLFLPYQSTQTAWERLLKRPIRAVAWSKGDVARLVGKERADRQSEIIKHIGERDILRFKIGLDGMDYRKIGRGDSVVCVVTDSEVERLTKPGGFYLSQLQHARTSSASTGVIFIGGEAAAEEVAAFAHDFVLDAAVIVPLPRNDFLLNGIKRVTTKLLLNALSTCTMVRMGRVLGNFMIWVVPSNLKLIDRSTRYISYLTGLPYEDSCRLLFQVIDYVEPRMKLGQEYPPPVGVAVIRARRGCTNEEAEELLKEGELTREA